ncbi:MAG: hypothetical protein EOO20_25300, partial [Chryseobacterium sp.]
VSYRYIPVLVFFILLFLIPLRTASAKTWSTTENCDMPSASLQEIKTATREECQTRCLENEKCEGVVYITGWKKCSLKSSVKKQAKLRFISADMDAQHAYQKGSYKLDYDHSGKDLQRLVLDSADQCGEACAGRADCSAFTYLEGYRVCWLKKTGGRPGEKVFSCSVKSAG